MADAMLPQNSTDDGISSENSEISETISQDYSSSASLSSDGDSVGKTDSKPSTWTREQKLTGTAMALMNFSTQVSFAVIAPFFPVEAGSKGATATEVGLIFGIFQLVIFITSPIYGRYINKFGATAMFLSGSVLCGVCNIIFGFLDEVTDKNLYIVLCFACRTLEANGASMLTTASFAIMAKQFPKNVGSALGVLKTFSGIGMALGPTIGGGLYSVGGYKTPFIVVGGIVLITSAASKCFLPIIDDVTILSGSFLDLMKSPGCIIIYLVTIGSSMALSSTDPTFSPFMSEKFNLSAGQIGLMFMTSPAVYALAAPFCGWVSDKGWHASCVIIGCFLNGISFLLQGPSPLLKWLIPLTILETILALILLGISVGFVLIPVFPMVIDMACSRGYPENLQTYGIISGFFNSASAFGSFIGPTASGYLSQHYGFEWSTSICGFNIMAAGFLLLIYVVAMKCMGRWPIIRRDNQQADSCVDEKTHLLGV